MLGKKIYPKYSSSGNSLIEVIVALAIFALISASMMSLATGGFVALEQGGEHTEAVALAQEGIEAVRAIRDSAWNRLEFAQSGVSIEEIVDSGPIERWIFDGESTTDTIDQYTRTITFADVCRDDNDDITSCAGSYTDPHTKQVTVTVEWTIRPGVTNSVTRGLYLSNWESSNFVQTNWVGGSGQTIWSDTTRYESGESINHSTAGELSIAEATDGTWVNAGGTLAMDDTLADFNDGTYTNTTASSTGSDGSVILSQGFSWSEHVDSDLITQNINDIVILSATDAWAVADSGKILRYDGTNWVENTDLGNSNIETIHAVSASDIWAAGASGKFYHYNGVAWSEAQDAGGMTWFGIHMVGASEGWAVGNQGKVYSYNGTTWSQDTDTGNHTWRAVYFNSSSDGWMVRNAGKIFQYNGTSWSEHTDTGGELWRDIKFSSASVGFTVGNTGEIAHYNGSTWDSTISSPVTTNLLALDVVSASNVYAAGVQGKILNYNGTSWSENADTGGEGWQGIGFSSASHGFVVGNGGEIFEYSNTYQSTGTFESEVIDSGKSGTDWDKAIWTELLPTGSDITVATRSGDTAVPDVSWSAWSAELTDETGSDITSPDARYFQYRLTLTRATDPNETPQLDEITIVYDAPTADHLRSLTIVTASDIWAVGNNGTIINYDGSSWSSVSSPVSDNLFGVDAVSASDIWAVGRSGKILNYNGTSWSEHTDTGAEAWNAVSMASSTFGFAGGNSANNLAEFDGSTWTEYAAPSNDNVNDIYTLSDGTAWAVADSGKIHYYNGSSWSEHTDIGAEDIEGIHMISASDGFAVGSAGKVWRYNGSTWSEETDTGGDLWEGVSMVDSSSGWFVGENGQIYEWDGSSWSSVSSPALDDLYEVAVVNSADAWAVGRSGQIMHFDQAALYKTSGVATSSAFDMSDSSPVQVIEWDETIPSCSPTCTVQFEVSTAPDDGGSPGTWGPWYGASGASTFFTNASGTVISRDLNNNQWLRYRVTLTGDGDDTPTLREVRINYK